MTGANEVLVTVLLTLTSVLVVFLIIVCVKLINTTDRMNIILDDVEKKLISVNGVFTAIDTVSDAVSSVGEAVVGKTLSLVDKVFKKDN